MKKNALSLTERDSALLEGIRAYGLLSTHTLSERFFPGTQQTTVMRRMRLLEKSKLIHRIPALETKGSALGY